MDLRDIRRARLLHLVADQKGRGKQRALARIIGKAPAQISQWINCTRTITEDTARQIEAKAKKPPGWLDRPLDSPNTTGHYALSLQAQEGAAAPPAPRPDFRETRGPSASEWQVLRDLEVYPEEERRKLMDAVHAEAERWRAIERELTTRAKARALDAE